MQGICRSGEITYYFKEFKSSSQQIYALVTSVHHARRYTNFFLSIWIQDSKKIATRLLAAFVSTCSIRIPSRPAPNNILGIITSTPPCQCRAAAATVTVT